MPQELPTWGDVVPGLRQQAAGRLFVLIGNGFSMNIWPAFDYTLLREKAFSEDLGDDRLGESEEQIFALYGANFERVLSALL